MTEDQVTALENKAAVALAQVKALQNKAIERANPNEDRGYLSRAWARAHSLEDDAKRARAAYIYEEEEHHGE
jgi:hypothetical protein